jgi:hypothetical protein
MSDWIATKNKLPRQDISVIGYDVFYGRIGEARLVDWGKRDHLVFVDSDDCHITHWMPLPEPPGDSNNDS